MKINYDKLSEEIKGRKDVLIGYSYLMDRIRLYHKEEKLLLEEAIEKAIEDTKMKGYLKEYLDRKEFVVMITKVLTIEEEMDLIRRDERKEGRKERDIEIAKASLKKGLSKDIIADITGLTIQNIEDLEDSLYVN